MNRVFKFIIFVFVFALMFSLVGCDDTPQGVNNLDVYTDGDPVFDRGEQVLTIVAVQNVDNPTKFKSTITIEDVKLSKYLEGKEVVGLTYVDDTTLTVTLAGYGKVFSGITQTGVLSISANACTNGENAYANVIVYNKDLYEEMNLQADDDLVVFDRGTQTVTIVASQEAKNPTKFKSTITKSDIVLGDYLSTKSVDKVEYVDETTIKVTLTGDVVDFEDTWDVGMLTVKARATTIGLDCYTYVKVYNTYMSVKLGDSKAGDPGNAYSEYYTIFTLNNGTFSLDFNPYDKISIVPYGDLTLPNPMTNGKIVSCMIDGNRLIIRINFVDQSISRYPKVKISAGLIPGSPEFEIEIGKDPLDYAPIIL